jgi:outer membrane protein
MKDMRARTRAPLALLTALLLVSGATTPFAVAQQAAPAEQQTLQLSLDEAVKRALENNADIVVARYNPQLSEQLVRGALGYYDPSLSGTFSRTSSDTKGTSAISGGASVNTKRDVWNLGVALPLAPSGGLVQLEFDNSRTDTNNAFSNYNPQYNSGFTLSLSQPLLRNLMIDSPRQQLRIARKNREISDVQFHATVVNTIAGVKIAYYNLIYAIDNLAAAQKSLALAKRLLNENEIRVKVGTMAPLDIVTAQAEVASREEGVIVAENAVGNAEDSLKQAIFPQNDPATWTTHIVPSDRPSAEQVPVDVEAAVKTALEKRTDVIAARKALESNDISLSYARNQLLPDLSLIASYGAAGAGGTQLERDPSVPFGGAVINTVPGGYGDALSEAFGRDYPTWSVGFQLKYSIPNRSLKAAAAQARITKDQAVASLRRLELNVAAQVRSAARGVESGFKRVGTTQAARVLAAQRLDAEEKKFAAGMSTNFLVMQAQRDLATAEVAELQAIAGYRQSIINFQRVQEAGVSGSGSTVTVAGSY